jgi:DNA-binding response OmpR family regulator
VLVVIAEKDPHELESLRAAFEASDCEVLAAFDGKVAVTLARERSPDAVVVTSSLGSMGGFAVSREIKTSAEAGEHREPKVVLLLEREADVWLAGWSRCDAWLVKPVDPQDVAELVGALLSPQAASA